MRPSMMISVKGTLSRRMKQIMRMRRTKMKMKVMMRMTMATSMQTSF